jgi:acetyltransferase-like isoleucine patch superfamily enzyme
MVNIFFKFLSFSYSEKIRCFRKLLIFLTDLFHNTLYRIGNMYNVVRFAWYGITYGKNFVSAGSIILNIYPGSRVVIGDNVIIISDSRRCSASAIAFPARFRTFAPSSKIIIGDNVGLNGTSITSRSKTITIGKDSMIAPNVIIVDSDFHVPWPPENRRFYSGNEVDGDITIGNNCWIGMNSIILKGVEIGDNSVIGSGSVVISDVPPNCLAAGTPAKVVKKYDENLQIN